MNAAREIGVRPDEVGPVQVDVLVETARLAHQIAHLHPLVKLEGPRPHHGGTADRDGVLQHVADAEDLEDVAVHELGARCPLGQHRGEREVDGAPIRVGVPGSFGERDHAIDLRAPEIGRGLNPAGQLQQVAESIPFLQLVDRRPMHLAQHRGHLSDRRHEHHVAALKPHVVGLRAGQDVAVEVHVPVDGVVPHDAHVAHRSPRRGASRVVEGIQHRRYGRDRVAAGPHDVPQDEDLDRVELAERHVHEGRGPAGADAGVDGGELERDETLRLLQRETAQHDLADVWHRDRGLARDGGGVRVLVIPPDLDDHLVARAERVVGIDRAGREGLECGGRVGEDLVAEGQHRRRCARKTGRDLARERRPVLGALRERHRRGPGRRGEERLRQGPARRLHGKTVELAARFDSKRLERVGVVARLAQGGANLVGRHAGRPQALANFGLGVAGLGGGLADIGVRLRRRVPGSDPRRPGGKHERPARYRGEQALTQ